MNVRLFPGQLDIGAETHVRSRALVSGLHDAGTGAGDDHVAFLGDFPREIDRLQILLPCRQRARRAENGHLAFVIVRGEEPEGVTQFAHRGADDSGVPTVFDVGQQLEGIDHDVFDQIGVIPAPLFRDQFLDAPAEGWLDRVFFRFVHVETMPLRQFGNKP
jgi:hypothetical protein